MVETSEELKNHLSKVGESLSQLRTTFQESITSNSITTNSIQTANVTQPLDEVPKLSSLLSAHATKLGLVFKPPIATTTYTACQTEVDSLLKYAALLLSLLTQIQLEKKNIPPSLPMSYLMTVLLSPRHAFLLSLVSKNLSMLTKKAYRISRQIKDWLALASFGKLAKNSLKPARVVQVEHSDRSLKRQTGLWLMH